MEIWHNLQEEVATFMAMPKRKRAKALEKRINKCLPQLNQVFPGAGELYFDKLRDLIKRAEAIEAKA